MSLVTFAVPTLETERLRFRAPSIDDFDDEVAFYATERSRGLGGPKPADEVWNVLTARIGHWVMRGYGLWALDDKQTGRYAGRAGLLNPRGWPEPEIGWTLMGHAEGRGLAYEAVLAIRAFAYSTLEWTTAISLIAEDNERSMALAQRLGCVRDGFFKHATYGDVPVWRHPGPEALG